MLFRSATNTSSLFLLYRLTPSTSHCSPLAAEEEQKTGNLGGTMCSVLFGQLLVTLAEFNLEHGSGPNIYGISEIEGFNSLCGLSA